MATASPQLVDFDIVPTLPRMLPILDEAVPSAFRNCIASSPNRWPAATADPIGPTSPGGW